MTINYDQYSARHNSITGFRWTFWDLASEYTGYHWINSAWWRVIKDDEQLYFNTVEVDRRTRDGLALVRSQMFSEGVLP